MKKKNTLGMLATACMCCLTTMAQLDTSQNKTGTPASVTSAPASNSPKWGLRKVALVGTGAISYVQDSSQSNFRDAQFHLMPLVHISKKCFLITEVEIETKDGVADFGIEQVDMYYKVNRFLTFHGGRFLPKFGSYRGKLGELFINRFAVDPVGYGDGGIGPMVETGFGALGSFQLGYSKLNYDVYVTNSPHLQNGINSPLEVAGTFDYESFYGFNKGKAVAGRIGFLPLPNSSLEIGVSGMYANKTGDIHTNYENVAAKMLAADFMFYHNISPLKSTIRLIGEYKTVIVDNIAYPTDSTVTGSPTFNNVSTAAYVQATIRPALLKNNFLKRLEFAYRYSEFHIPDGSPWGQGPTYQSAFALNYWITWGCVFKINYVVQSYKSDMIVGQLVYRF
jgi:hypothetical protein